jgi:hypothetical protein
MARFCFVCRRNLSLYAIFQLSLGAERSAYSSWQQILSQCYLGREWLRQARPSYAVGKPGRKIITNGFHSNRLLRQKRLRKSADSCKLGRRRLRQARPMAGWAAESKQTVFGYP